MSESGVVEVWSKSTWKFVVNGNRLKPYHPYDSIYNHGCTLMLYPLNGLNNLSRATKIK